MVQFLSAAAAVLSSLVVGLLLPADVMCARMQEPQLEVQVLVTLGQHEATAAGFAFSQLRLRAVFGVWLDSQGGSSPVCAVVVELGVGARHIAGERTGARVHQPVDCVGQKCSFHAMAGHVSVSSLFR